MSKYIVKNISIVTLLVCFATVPLPTFDGSPTGAKYIHDHAIKWINRNRDAISDTHEMAIVMDDRKGVQFQLWQLETLILQANESVKLTEDRRAAIIKRYERKLERLEKSLEKKNDKIEYLDSKWSGYGIASTAN